MVSNLLSSPASGELICNTLSCSYPLKSFQFIEFPSEWGGEEGTSLSTSPCVSNLLSSPASGEFTTSAATLWALSSFQFIGFPSEWGGKNASRKGLYTEQVSNLLGSPASGETFPVPVVHFSRKGFQFIGFPSEWGEKVLLGCWCKPSAFPIYWVPQRVGRPVFAHPCRPVSPSFPIYWVPQRVGRRFNLIPPIPSTVFPIYWVPQRVGSPAVFRPLQRYHRFQFIGFPSEWGG